MTDTTTAPVYAESLVGQRVGYADDAYNWYSGDPRRSAVGDAVDWRIEDGVEEAQVRWWVGHTSWVPADKLRAIPTT